MARVRLMIIMGVVVLPVCGGGGCFAPPPSDERAEAGLKVAGAFFEAMRAGNVAEARKYTTFQEDRQLSDYVLVFKDGKPEKEAAGTVGSTNRLYMDFVILSAGGSRTRIRLTFHDRSWNADGTWVGDRIQSIEILDPVPARP